MSSQSSMPGTFLSPMREGRIAKPRSGSSYSSSSFKERKKENTWTAWHIHTQTGTNTKHNSTKHVYQIPIYLSIYLSIHLSIYLSIYMCVCDKRSPRPLATGHLVCRRCKNGYKYVFHVFPHYNLSLFASKHYPGLHWTAPCYVQMCFTVFLSTCIALSTMSSPGCPFKPTKASYLVFSYVVFSDRFSESSLANCP